jgi:phosphoribosylpyrophosphate synthetase
LADFLDGNFTKEEMKNVVVCVIPASTQYKNDLRYKALCTKIAEKFPVINGYDYISIVSDRSDSRGQKSSDTVWNLSFSSSVRGKTIVLFDDITTRGTSFIQVASKLKEKGAANVIGFFLGKTVAY